ncbi:serine/threonine protein kinase [Leptolyngbya sp. AN02str]|uniref:serine/threonine protein kinase n=1 Tax=Leptolyngbya sp. AN02str TaxID=3423363 RepID=UPI003D313CBE
MERFHHSDEIIAQRYQILRVLGQGGIGITYAAMDLQTNQQVALKALSLRRLNDFKVLDLFEREARTLEQLNHPAIPRYLDYFQIDQADNRSFYLVQQLAEGQDLTTLVEKGWRPNETDVKQIAVQILNILVYLQELTPPVIHRDIKPQNIIYRDDGQVVLVDFGAVQDTYHNTMTGGSTVVGTYGYMAPEQFRGQAVLSTDLYGLGTTLIFLLSGKPPADLPQRKLKINFRPYIHVSQTFADWLECLIDPVADDRFPSANDALAVLLGERTLAATQKRDRPSRSPITFIRDDHELLVKIPPTWLRSTHSRLLSLFPLASTSFLLVMIWMILASGYSMTPASLLLLMIYGGISLWMAGLFLISAASQTRLEMNSARLRLRRSLWDISLADVSATPAEIMNAELQPTKLSVGRTPLTVCVVKVRRSRYRFGFFLTESEKAWLISEIAQVVQAHKTIPTTAEDTEALKHSQ